VKHKANGGKTSVKDCVLLCFFHHEVVIHRWGWTLVLNPDGATTAWSHAGLVAGPGGRRPVSQLMSARVAAPDVTATGTGGHLGKACRVTTTSR
jgi:hypothetical protein